MFVSMLMSIQRCWLAHARVLAPGPTAGASKQGRWWSAARLCNLDAPIDALRRTSFLPPSLNLSQPSHKTRNGIVMRK